MALTEKRKVSMYRYAREKLKRIPLDVPKKKYEEIKRYTESRGETVNGFIKRAIRETMERDGEYVPDGTASETVSEAAEGEGQTAKE